MRRKKFEWKWSRLQREWRLGGNQSQSQPETGFYVSNSVLESSINWGLWSDVSLCLDTYCFLVVGLPLWREGSLPLVQEVEGLMFKSWERGGGHWKMKIRSQKSILIRREVWSYRTVSADFSGFCDHAGTVSVNCHWGFSLTYPSQCRWKTYKFASSTISR
jgi:hypothetical protein